MTLSRPRQGFILPLLVLFVLGSFAIIYLVVTYLPNFKSAFPLPGPAKKGDSLIAQLCAKNDFAKIRKCSTYLVGIRNCCDQPDDIFDLSGNLITTCGGFAGYSKSCQQNYPQTSCQEITCPQTTPIPTSSPDETANWKTYLNTKYGFQINYPKELTIDGQYISETDYFHGWIGKQIFFSISKINPSDCRGDCPVINKSREELVGGLTRTILEGYVGSVGGETPQNYLSYVYRKSKYYYTFTLYELEKDNALPIDRRLESISEEKIKLFNQILSTFRFLDASPEGQFCGGFAGTPCPEGYKCQLEDNYPDAGGKCIKK